MYTLKNIYNGKVILFTVVTKDIKCLGMNWTKKYAGTFK